MKFVRTKDGHIYNVAISVFGTFAISKEDRVIKEIAEKNILKSADTIEELCDLFIYALAKDDLEKFFFYDKNSDAFVNIHNLELVFERYGMTAKFLKGAIWTKKGLTYVAKVNEKGDLELL